MTDWWARLERQWRVEDLQTEEAEAGAEALKDPEGTPRALKTARRTTGSSGLPPALLWMNMWSNFGYCSSGAAVAPLVPDAGRRAPRRPRIGGGS